MTGKENRVFTWTVNSLIPTSTFSLFLFLFFSSQPLIAQDEYASLFSMSMDELMQIKVVSVHKETEPFITTPAAVYVITREDIAMSAAESIPDLLVRVPGVNTFQSRRHNASVGIRDDTQKFFSTSLVLVDGVPCYWPITGGALFETISVALEDIERIEVIRGSGGSSWGANAASGVINIITRNAHDASGTTLSATLGNKSRYAGTLQYGLGNDSHALRLTIHGERDDGFTQDVITKEDFNRKLLSARYDGTVADWIVSAAGAVMGIESTAENLLTYEPDEDDLSNLFLMIRAEKPLKNGDTIRLQPSIIRNKAESSVFETEYDWTMADFEGLYQKRWTENQSTQFSANFREYDIKTDARGFLIRSVPPEGKMNLIALGFHHNIVFPKSIKLEFGLRAESYSSLPDNWVFSPSGRLSYHMTDNLFFWAAIAKSYQFPSFIQNTVRVTTGFDPVSNRAFQQWGNKELEPEESMDYQAGLRWRLPSHLLDLAVYYRDVKDQVYVDPHSATLLPGAVVSFHENLINAKVSGVELSWSYFASDQVNTQINLTYFDKDEEIVGNDELYPDIAPSYAPEYKISWITNISFPWGTRFSGVLTWMDDYVSENVQGIFADPVWIDDHFRLDVQARHFFLKDRLEMAFGAKNIFNDDYEWKSLGVTPRPEKVDASYYVKAVYHFD